LCRLWRGKLAECLPWWSAAALQRLQATTALAADGVVDDGAASKHLDDQWTAICLRLGFNDEASSDRKTSPRAAVADEEEVSDLHRLYTCSSSSSSDETGQTDDDQAAADLRPSADASRELAQECEELAAHHAQPPPQQQKRQNESDDEKGAGVLLQAVTEIEAGRENEEGKKEEEDKNTLPLLQRKEDWRYTCLALLNTERNWYRGDIRPINRLPVSADVLCLDFDEDQQLLVTGSKDGSRGEISVWHLRTGEQLFSFEGHRWWVNDLHLRGDRVFSCSNDATVTVWGIKERSSVKVLQGHGAGVQSISFHPHQPHILLSGSWDNTVKLWDVNTNELLDTFPFANTASGEQAWAVSVSEKGMLLGVGQSGWLCAWDHRQRTPIFAYQPQEMRHSVGTFRYRTGFHCVQFNEAGDRCIVAGSHLPATDPSAVESQKDLDGIIQEYDLTGGEPQCLRTFKGTNSSVRAIQFDQGKLVAGDFDSRIKVWDLATGALQTNFKNWLPVSFEPSPNFENRIYKLKYSPTGLMVTGEANSVGIWDVSGRRKPSLSHRAPSLTTTTDAN